MKEKDKVILRSFNGTKKSDEDIDKSENYWLLIGSTGLIVKDPKEKTIYAGFSKEKRVLVKFDKNINSLHLDCHNPIENSLWVLETDLERI